MCDRFYIIVRIIYLFHILKNKKRCALFLEYSNIPYSKKINLMFVIFKWNTPFDWCHIPYSMKKKAVFAQAVKLNHDKNYLKCKTFTFIYSRNLVGRRGFKKNQIV